MQGMVPDRQLSKPVHIPASSQQNHAPYAQRLNTANKAHCPTSRSAKTTISKMSTESTVIEEHHIHGFLGYFTVAASLLTIGSTLGLLIEQYERAGRSLSTRQGVHRRRLVQIFLGLALACFVVVTTLKYASPVARAEVGETLAGGHAGGTANGFETRSAEDGYAGIGNAGVAEQKPAAMR